MLEIAVLMGIVPLLQVKSSIKILWRDQIVQKIAGCAVSSSSRPAHSGVALKALISELEMDWSVLLHESTCAALAQSVADPSPHTAGQHGTAAPFTAAIAAAAAAIGV